MLCNFYLETSVHEPGHFKNVNQVQGVRVVMFHALKEKIINESISISTHISIFSPNQIWVAILQNLKDEIGITTVVHLVSIFCFKKSTPFQYQFLNECPHHYQFDINVFHLRDPVDNVYIHVFQSGAFAVKHPRNLTTLILRSEVKTKVFSSSYLAHATY